MAAFKQHCSFGFWKRDLVLGKSNSKEGAMGSLGRIVDHSDLPSDKVLIAYIRNAARLNAEGVKAPRKRSKLNKVLIVPDDLSAALKKNRKAEKAFVQFSHCHKAEHVEWITGAMREETRQRPLAQTIEWLEEGKARNWKYEWCQAVKSAIRRRRVRSSVFPIADDAIKQPATIGARPSS